MEKFEVTGMGCARCAAKVEKTVNQVPGVTSCTVSLPKTMVVEGTADVQSIIQAVAGAGYRASVCPGD